MNEEKVLQWLIHQKNTDEIEDVSDTVLENMIDSTNYLAVLFCKYYYLMNLFNSIYIYKTTYGSGFVS